MTEPLHRELDRLDLDLQVAAALLRFERKFPEILSEEGARNARMPAQHLAADTSRRILIPEPDLERVMRETYDVCQSWTPPRQPSIWWPIFFSSLGVVGLVMAFWGALELAR